MTNLVNPGSQNTCIFEKQAIPALCNIKKARLSAIFVFTLYPLKRPGFSMVHYSVNQAINDKKSFIKIQNSMFTKCDINNTYKSSGIHAHTSVTVSPVFQIRSKFHHWKWTTNFKGFILHVFSLDKLQWNEKSLFSRSIQMFILPQMSSTQII